MFANSCSFHEHVRVLVLDLTKQLTKSETQIDEYTGPDSGLSVQIQVLKALQVVSSSLGSGDLAAVRQVFDDIKRRGNTLHGSRALI